MSGNTHIWNDRVDGRKGVYCSGCDTVIYFLEETIEDHMGRCPICKERSLLYIIGTQWQPRNIPTRRNTNIFEV